MPCSDLCILLQTHEVDDVVRLRREPVRGRWGRPVVSGRRNSRWRPAETVRWRGRLLSGSPADDDDRRSPWSTRWSSMRAAQAAECASTAGRHRTARRAWRSSRAESKRFTTGRSSQDCRVPPTFRKSPTTSTDYSQKPPSTCLDHCNALRPSTSWPLAVSLS